MKQLNNEEKLSVLAYGGIYSIRRFIKSNPELPEALTNRAISICTISRLIAEQKKFQQFAGKMIKTNLDDEEIQKFFDSLVLGNEDDPKEIKLITNFLEGLYESTGSGEGDYFNFEPFLYANNEAWLKLLFRIQKNSTVSSELKELVELYFARGLKLILNPSIQVLENFNFNDFTWFKNIDISGKEKIIARAVNRWRELSTDGSYGIKRNQCEAHYVSAIKFAISMSSLGFVSQTFADNFWSAIPDVFIQFNTIIEFRDFQVREINLRFRKSVQKSNKATLLDLFKTSSRTPKSLAKLLSVHPQVSALVKIIMEINCDSLYYSYSHTREAMQFLVEKHKECALVKKLITLFTENLEKKVDNGTLVEADLPPTVLYVSNPELNWLFVNVYE